MIDVIRLILVSLGIVFSYMLFLGILVVIAERIDDNR